MEHIVELIDAVIVDPENESSIKKIRKRVHKLMEDFPLYKHNKALD